MVTTGVIIRTKGSSKTMGPAAAPARPLPRAIITPPPRVRYAMTRKATEGGGERDREHRADDQRLDWPVPWAICRKRGRTRRMESAQTRTIATLSAFPARWNPERPAERAPRRIRPAPTARRTSESRTAAYPEYGFQSIRPNE